MDGDEHDRSRKQFSGSGDDDDSDLSPAEEKVMQQFQSLRKLQNESFNEEESLELTSRNKLPMTNQQRQHDSDSEFGTPRFVRPIFSQSADLPPEHAPPPPPDQSRWSQGLASLESIELRDLDLGAQPAHQDVEASLPEQREAEECESCGRLNFVGTYLLGLRERLSTTKTILLILSLIFFIGFIVFLGVFPTSFVYVEYYEIALKQSVLTGAVDKEDALYPGCYVLTPDIRLIRLSSTAHMVEVEIDIFTLSKVVIEIEFTLQYFLKPAEVGQLYGKFGLDYESTIKGVIISTFKNTAAQFSLVEYRLDRDQLEKHFHQVIRDRLNGDCCPACCPSKCKKSDTCKSCNFRQSCHTSYHVDLRYFQLGKIGIPQEVFQQFTRQTILQIEAEREFFVQEHALEVKQTEQESQKLLNEAQQILANATAQADAVTLKVKADAEKKRTHAYVKALRRLYGRLNITQEDLKLSLLMMRTYEDIKHNVYAYNYDKMTIVRP